MAVAALAESARCALESLMHAGKCEYQTEFARRYFAQGTTQCEAEGRARVLLAFLAAGGVSLSEAQRARDECLLEHGIRGLRLWNPEVIKEPEVVLDLIGACVHGSEVPARRGRVDVS
jgi:hypothetical protein